MHTSDNNNFDVIIIGGSYAGLSAAMALGRSLRSVLIIDSGLPCNRQTPHSHNFLTQDGSTPAEISKLALAQVLEYKTVSFLQATAISGTQTPTGFSITADSGENFNAHKLIVATGIKDIMPDIEGFAECWGISAIHCPYCHGYEFQNKKTAIMAGPEKAYHFASLVNNLTPHLSILASPDTKFNEEQLTKLNQHKIDIIEKPVKKIQHTQGHMQNIIFHDGTEMELDALYAGLAFTQHCDIPLSLGCELTEHGYIKVDAFQKTNIKGLYACGDNSAMMRSVANAVYAGNITGAMVNKELVDDRF